MTGIDGSFRGRLQVGDGLLLPALQDKFEGMRVHPFDLVSFLRFFVVDPELGCLARNLRGQCRGGNQGEEENDVDVGLVHVSRNGSSRAKAGCLLLSKKIHRESSQAFPLKSEVHQ